MHICLRPLSPYLWPISQRQRAQLLTTIKRTTPAYCTAMARKRALPASYRIAKPLPYQLEQQVRVFFGEKLYTIALTFLLNILSSGAPAWTPAHVPPASYLAIAATCLVHPRTTTRASSSGEKGAASVSLDLLRTANESIGPMGANLGDAFSFRYFEPDWLEMNPINVPLAQAGSLWARAEGFWHALGWAFNCSVLYPERWKWWRVWVEFMCEVLEDDWNERVKLAAERGSEKGQEDEKEEVLRGSIIFGYIDRGHAEGFGGHRRILRAIFADASAKAVNEFGQVFPRELEPADESNGNAKKRTSDVNDQYGANLSVDEGEEDMDKDPNSASRRPKRRRRSNKNATTTASTPNNPAETTTTTTTSLTLHPDTSYLGGLPSLEQRKRLLSLLSSVSSHLPKAFLALDELNLLLVENIRHLSLADFQALVSPTTLDSFTLPQQSSLCEYLLHSMRETSAPKIAANKEDTLQPQIKLERYFLPYAANTTGIVANAKVGVTLAAWMVVLDKQGLLGNGTDTDIEGLKRAVEVGIKAREKRAEWRDGRRKKTIGSVEEEEQTSAEWAWLRESGAFLRFLVGGGDGV